MVPLRSIVPLNDITGCIYSATIYQIFYASHKFSLVMGPVLSSTNSTPWGAYRPAAITALVTAQAGTIQLGTHRLLGRESALVYRWSDFPRDTPPHCSSRDPHLRSLDPRSWATGTCATTTGMYMEYIFRYGDPEGGHCQGACHPQWFFTSRSKSARWLRHLSVCASHERYTVASVEGRKIYLHNFCPSGSQTAGRRAFYPLGYCATSWW